ncbi:NDP-hexose 2,3-dehydratase family protein [Micromonospora sp. ATCC 39149]|uniref:NDP-hexose 2,3-dehydratase family protein n=1 Tax=Micromonospora sp. (strain ATCC 39149 / NRRL 15099 / SCC 1413) TaxID=219305 RepID=UPI000011DC31|nr:NDP-hexose 2,3-dehydratase family protein [Micromonospora sp. ATCC 39149]
MSDSSPDPKVRADGPLLTRDAGPHRPGPVDGGSWSALHAEGVRPDFLSWFAERTRSTYCRVDRVPLDRLPGWAFDPVTGNLGHESGRFFVIEGLHVQTTYGAVREWHQPIINQPEIGILGMLVKVVDGTPYCLLQAKVEPGNINVMQLSPTVQATRSNYTRVHRGGGTKYLDYFTRPGAGRVLVDVLQSEQGSWFLRKRNRNMVVQVDEDVPAGDYHRWLPLRELLALLRVDGLVNMDTRTVLSCLPSAFYAAAQETEAPSSPAVAAIVRSAAGAPGRHDLVSVLSWFTGAKGRHEMTVRRVPLRGLPDWRHTADGIARDDGRHFSVVGVTVRIDNREVTGWSQPLLYPRHRGVVAFLVKEIDGVAHLLVHARYQAGLLDAMEMGPTVQCIPDNQPGPRPLFLAEVLEAAPERVLYDTVLTEEGGRFYRSENRYLLVDAGDDFPTEVPDEFCWVTVRQLEALLRHGYYLNIEARSLLACLRSLW